jgi:SAM-dependent methyltransferase
MAYADGTISDPNAIKRWLHKQRFRDALRVLRAADSTKPIKVLDFGGGDGELLRQCLQIHPLVSACLYEPTPWLRKEAQAKLSASKSIRITSELSLIEKQSFDLVFCLEVFEHLPHEATREAIASIYDLLNRNGLAVVGVPHEIFAPALLKGIFRMARRYGEYDALPRNVLMASVGRPPQNRPVAEISPGFAYHFHHLGFDYRDLEAGLATRFNIIRKWFSPVRMFGPLLNSEVYYLLRKT